MCPVASNQPKAAHREKQKNNTHTQTHNSSSLGVDSSFPIPIPFFSSILVSKKPEKPFFLGFKGFSRKMFGSLVLPGFQKRFSKKTGSVSFWVCDGFPKRFGSLERMEMEGTLEYKMFIVLFRNRLFPPGLRFSRNTFFRIPGKNRNGRYP